VESLTFLLVADGLRGWSITRDTCILMSTAFDVEIMLDKLSAIGDEPFKVQHNFSQKRVS
jgi:hypothetical protein